MIGAGLKALKDEDAPAIKRLFAMFAVTQVWKEGHSLVRTIAHSCARLWACGFQPTGRFRALDSSR